MLHISHSLLLILASQISLMCALPVLPNPDPAAVQPSLVFPTAAPPATIPAFPEQSAASGGGGICTLDFSKDLVAGVSAACSPRRHRRAASRSRCCPALAASLYSAYATSALSSASAGDLPVLPDDSESCTSAAERAIAGRGVELPRVNATCGAAYCYCGIRLRRLSCGAGRSPAHAGVGEWKWAPREEWALRLEKDCSRPGLAECSLCLRTLNQLREAGVNATAKDGKSVRSRDNDCQLIGLTWLLSKNRTLYLPIATAVLRAFMPVEGGAAASSDGGQGPTSCLLSRDEMPIAVGASEIDGDDGTEFSAAGIQPPSLLLMAFSFLLGMPSSVGR